MYMSNVNSSKKDKKNRIAEKSNNSIFNSEPSKYSTYADSRFLKMDYMFPSSFSKVKSCDDTLYEINQMVTFKLEQLKEGIFKERINNISLKENEELFRNQLASLNQKNLEGEHELKTIETEIDSNRSLNNILRSQVNQVDMSNKSENPIQIIQKIELSKIVEYKSNKLMGLKEELRDISENHTTEISLINKNITEIEAKISKLNYEIQEKLSSLKEKEKQKKYISNKIKEDTKVLEKVSKAKFNKF